MQPRSKNPCYACVFNSGGAPWRVSRVPRLGRPLLRVPSLVEMSARDDDTSAERGTVVGVLAVRSAVRERLAAAGTAIRLLTAVQTAVLGQMMLVFERAMTHLARERSQACQHSAAPNRTASLICTSAV